MSVSEIQGKKYQYEINHHDISNIRLTFETNNKPLEQFGKFVGDVPWCVLRSQQGGLNLHGINNNDSHHLLSNYYVANSVPETLLFH